jgi:hypothetical protein
VVVDDLYDFDGLDGTPIQAAVVRHRKLIGGRPYHQTLPIGKLQGQLAVPITVKLMASAWQVPKVLKAACRFQVCESRGDPLGTGRTVLPLERPMLFACLLQPPLSKRNLQGRSFRFLFNQLSV